MSDQPIRSRSLEEDLKSNRDACQKILQRYAPHHSIEFELLQGSKLADTPFEVIAALLWCYQTIRDQDQSIRLSVDLNKRALTDNTELRREVSRLQTSIVQAFRKLGISPWGRLDTFPGVEAAVDHLKALEDAVLFTQDFLARLEGTDPEDPLFEIRRRFHAPLHEKLDAALKGVSNV
jgi:hypothetical protein